MDSSDINSIGSKLSDFEEVPNKKKIQTIQYLEKDTLAMLKK